MKNNLKVEILNSISAVYEKSAKCKLKDSMPDTIDNELSILSHYFQLNCKQSFMLANIIAINYKGKGVVMEDLHKHFKCNPIDIMQWSDEINFLIDNCYVKASYKANSSGSDFLNTEMSVNNLISEAILKNEPLPQLEKKNINDPIELLEEIFQLVKKRYNDDLGFYFLMNRLSKLLSKNVKNPWAIYCQNLGLSEDDIAILSYIVWKNLTGEKEVDLSNVLEFVYSSSSRMVNTFQYIVKKEHILTDNKLIEVKEAVFYNSTEVTISKKLDKQLEEMGINTMSADEKHDNIISSKSLVEKALHYNQSEKSEIERLKKMLEEKTLQQTRKRLEERKLPKGIVALFYGSPGTGKTESVKQLAKATGRDIFKVEISQTKSMWFGESEKLIKQVFTDYKSFCEKSKKIPILLFNEADAVLSKRNKVTGSSVDQTMNAIQNILLEEFENFDGILIATTNLTGNLDSAFERRFLFKVEFNKPVIEVKAKIWQEKIQSLSNKEALILSEKFDFSGGQIDNIVRKKEIDEIINGINVGFEDILGYCSNEVFERSKSNKVGFSL